MSSKAEYLKRYLSKDESGGKKKKKRRKKKKTIRAGIDAVIDEDHDWRTIDPNSLDLKGEDAPVIVDFAEYKKKFMGGSDKEDSDIDLAFVRVERHDGSGWKDDTVNDTSANKNNDSDSDQDLSPDRGTRMDSDSDSDLDVRRGGGAGGGRMDSDSDSDVDVSRKSAGGRMDSDSDSDIDVTRKQDGGRMDSDSDVDVSRSQDSDSDIDVTRRQDSKQQDQGMGEDSDGDFSPTRRGEPENVKGLQTGAEFAAYRNHKQALKQKALDAVKQDGGKTVHRDKKTGKILSEADIKALAEKARKAKEEPKMEWASGLTQKRQKAEQNAAAAAESSAPFARDRNDAAMNSGLMEELHWDDPMYEAMMKKRQAKAQKERAKMLRKEEKRRKKEEKKKKKAMKKAKKLGLPLPVESKEAPKVAKLPRPYYQGQPWENRFGIRPGYRWDGVNRANGFEGEVFKMKHEKRVKASRG